MTETKKVRNPYHLQKRAGTKIRPDDQRILERVSNELHAKGYAVLGITFAKVPGFLQFVATVYRMDQATDERPAPFGFVRVSFLRNGVVTVTVSGVRRDQWEPIGMLGISWK